MQRVAQVGLQSPLTQARTLLGQGRRVDARDGTVLRAGDHRRDEVVTAADMHQFIPVLAMVIKNGSTTKPPSNRAITRAALALPLADDLVFGVHHGKKRSATSTVKSAKR